MCKGVAVLANDKEVLIGKDSKHRAVAQDVDKYVKINVIYDDREERGYRIELDTDNSYNSLEHYQENGWVQKCGSLKTSIYQAVLEKLEANRGDIFHALCENLQNATIEGDQFNNSATITGNQSNDSATIKGDQSNDSATIKGDQSNYSATIEGDQFNDSATIKGKIIIYGMRNGGENLQSLLDEFTKNNEKDWRKATLENFVKFVQDKAKKKP